MTEGTLSNLCALRAKSSVRVDHKRYDTVVLVPAHLSETAKPAIEQSCRHL